MLREKIWLVEGKEISRMRKGQTGTGAGSRQRGRITFRDNIAIIYRYVENRALKFLVLRHCKFSMSLLEHSRNLES